MRKKEFEVIKSSGDKALFSYEKLKRSLRKSGAHPHVIDMIMEDLSEKVYDGISTRKIYKEAFNLLKRKKFRPFAARYKLKSAISELGPSGYPFEQYVSEIFKSRGYNTKLNQLCEGMTVVHEVDAIAEKENELNLIECKYHKSQSYSCDIKVPLYIHSRFNDISNKYSSNKKNPRKFFTGWIVTNTRFTLDAIKYSNYYGLKLVAWNYPEKGSLRDLTDQYSLYPITTLTTLNKMQKEILLSKKIILCMDICNNPDILNKIGLDESKSLEILDECRMLCGID